MELINHRYKIIKELNELDGNSSYLCSDVWDDNKLLKLNIMDESRISKELIDYYINEFIGISRLDSQELIKNYSFDRVTELDNKTNLEKQYLYTSQYVKESVGLLEHIQDKDIFEIMDLFIDICKTIHYLHINGYVYGAIKLSNIFIVKDKDQNLLKLKDIATVKLEEDRFDKALVRNKCFEPLDMLDISDKDRRFDMYSIGVLLLSMIKKKECSSSPNEIIQRFKNRILLKDKMGFREEEIKFLLELLPIIQKLLSLKKEYAYRYIYEFVDEVNEKTGSEYFIVDKEKLQKLNLYTKLVGREDEITNIKKAYENMKEYRGNKKVYLLEGSSGIGKTRFLKEVEFLLRLKGANVYSSFKLNNLNDDNYMWEDIFVRMTLEADKDIVESYKADLKKFAPYIKDFRYIGLIESFKNSSNRYKVLNRIAGFIIDSLKDKPSVIIIDNLHLASEFTLDVLKYLHCEIANDKNIILIFSYKEDKSINNDNFLEFIGDFKKNNEAYYSKLGNLDKDQTNEMVKNILTMDHTPKILGGKIYSKAYGNPFFITEILKDLYANEKIYIRQRSGLWYINLPQKDTEYNDLHIPNNIEQVLLNQLNGINDIEEMIINTIAVSFKPINLEDLKILLDRELELIGLDSEEAIVELELLELINNGILVKAFKDHKEIYELNNKVLNDIVYERIPDDIKIKIHRSIGRMLQEKIEKELAIDLDELIYHFERAGEREKARIYLIKSSNDKYRLKNIKGAIKDLERAIFYIDEDDTSQKISLTLKKAEMYIEIEHIDEAEECLATLEVLSESIGDRKSIMRVYDLRVEIYIMKGNDESAKYYLEKIWSILETIDDEYMELKFKKIRAIMHYKEEEKEECMALCKEVIEECGATYIKIKGDCYRLLSLCYISLNRFEEAIELNEKSVELLESIGYTKGVVYSLNNIGTIYHDNYQDGDKALEYYEKIIDISKQNDVLSGELVGLTNMGVLYHDKCNYELAYEYYKKALKRAIDANYKDNTIFLYSVLTTLCLDMSQYSKAYDYYKLSVKLSEGNKQALNDLKLVSEELYFRFGDFDKAAGYNSIALEYLKVVRTSKKYKHSIRDYLFKIITKDIDEYDCYIDDIIRISNNIEMTHQRIIELIKVAEALYRKEDFKNADKLFLIIEESMDEGINAESKSYYYYIKGLMYYNRYYLEKALILAKENKNKLLEANTKFELGNYYYYRKKLYKSLSYYIGGAEIIRSIIYDTPDKFKLRLVNNYNYSIIFRRISYLSAAMLNTKEADKDIEWTPEEFKFDSLKELSDILSEDYTIFADDKEFMSRYSEEYLSGFRKSRFEESSIIDNLDNNIIDNLELVIKKFSALTLASKAAIIIEENDELSLIASAGSDRDIRVNKYILDRLKSSMEPMLLSNRSVLNEYESKLLNGDLKANMYIPISTGYSKLYLNRYKTKSKKLSNKVLGYLYLETDNTLNNFNEEVLKQNIGLINLVAILCEKYILKKIATIDKLTGALTRKYLEDAIEELVKFGRDNDTKFSIIMYDLDRFKRINDKFGHQTGDEVLKKVSKLVIDNLHRESMLGRYGGEEFVIVLPDIGAREALIIADDIREKIYKAKILGDLSPISISSGVSTYPKHGNTSNQLIEKADQALYSAKENGRNRCELWNKNISSITKPISKLDGVITGDDVRDSRNILAIVETIELINSNLDREYKIEAYLSRIMETLEAEYGYLNLLEDGKIVESYEKRAREEELTNNFYCNREIIDKVIKTREGIYMIDWKDVRKDSGVTGIPIWNSTLAVPIVQKGIVIGVICLLASTKSKEFGINDLNFANVYSNLLHL